MIAVDQRQGGAGRQALNRAAHGQFGGAQDVQPVDLLHRGKGDGPAQCARLDVGFGYLTGGF